MYCRSKGWVARKLLWLSVLMGLDMVVLVAFSELERKGGGGETGRGGDEGVAFSIRAQVR